MSDGKSKETLKDKSKLKRKASSAGGKSAKKIKTKETVKTKRIEAELCGESQEKDQKVSRKKKKLLKWKEKARLRKEAKNAHTVKGEVLPLPLHEDDGKEMDITSVSYKGKDNERRKEKNTAISKLKKGLYALISISFCTFAFN